MPPQLQSCPDLLHGRVGPVGHTHTQRVVPTVKQGGWLCYPWISHSSAIRCPLAKADLQKRGQLGAVSTWGHRERLSGWGTNSTLQTLPTGLLHPAPPGGPPSLTEPCTAASYLLPHSKPNGKQHPQKQKTSAEARRDSGLVHRCTAGQLWAREQRSVPLNPGPSDLGVWALAATSPASFR